MSDKKTTVEALLEDVRAQLDAVRQRVTALENETPELRAQREQRLWEAERQRSAITQAMRHRESRLAENRRVLDDLEPWLDFLTGLRAEVAAKREAVLATLPGDPAREQLQDLGDMLLGIDGVENWRNLTGDLPTRAAASGIPVKPGCRNPLEDRMMLPNTLRTVGALRQERVVLEAELEGLRRELQTAS
jgi:hypothetical protein